MDVSTLDELMGTLLMKTVKRQLEGFTPKEIKESSLAYKAMQMVGNLSDTNMGTPMSSPTIENVPPYLLCRPTNACTIHGPERLAVRGKTVLKKVERVDIELMSIPRQVYDGMVMIMAELMFVNGGAF